MAENKLKIQHLRSKELVDGKPKLPTELDEGEIAINFANGHETIAIKNDRNQIVKIRNIVDEDYEPTQYNGKFETLVTETNHVKAGDTNSKAFKSVENTMSTLVDEVYKNEKAIVTTFGTVGSATGIVDAEGNISYQTKADAHYIAPATSVHKATVLLDNSLNRVETTVNEHQNQITAVKATADQNKTDIGGLASSIGIEKETEGTYSYPDNIGSNYFEDATSVIQAMTALDNEIYNVNGKARNIATATGVINDQDVIGYQKENGVAYIADATSVHDATVKLAIQLQQTTGTSEQTFQNIKDLAIVVDGAVKNSEGAYVYPANNNTKYIAGAHSVHEATVLLDSSLSRNENNIEKLAESTGMKMNENNHAYEYTPEETTNYIGDAVSVHDATVKLDNKLQEIEDTSNAHTQDISDLAKVAGGAVRNSGRFVYQADNNTKYIAGAHSVHEATVLLDTALKQLCPINLDYVEIEGVKWLTFDFNAFIGHTYHWGSLGDETQSPFPLRTTSDWDAIKNIVAPLSSKNENEELVERTRLLSPSFDIIYHLTHGHARIARAYEYAKLNNFANKHFSPGLAGSPGTWVCNGVKFVAGIYKTAEVGVRFEVYNKAGIMLNYLSSNEQEGRIMGVLIK